MHVAWRLHSLVCHFFWFSLVCWGFVQGYLHRGCLCKRETRTEAELVERVEVAGALSIPVIGNILSGMFLVAGAVQPSLTHGASYFGVYDFAFRDLEIRAGPLTKEVCVHGAKHASAWSCRRCCLYLRFPACGRAPNPISRSDHKLALSQTETLMQQKMFERNQMAMPGLLNSFRCVD